MLQGLQRGQLPFDGQPVQQPLFQLRQALKLLAQQLTDAVKRRDAPCQEGGDVPSKEFVYRLANDFKGQRVARVALHQLAPGGLAAEEAFVLQELLTSWRRQTAQPERSHRSLPAAELPQLRELFATGQ